MIGVAFRKGQSNAVEEFFELFKVPWEKISENGKYDAVLTTDPCVDIPSAKLTVVFGSLQFRDDPQSWSGFLTKQQKTVVDWNGLRIPIYGISSFFPGIAGSFLVTQEGKTAGYVLEQQGKTILRIGYDLFDEVDHLIRHGQPVENSEIPTLDLHISMLRSWILRAGVPVAEVPPVPDGYDFVTCLTHDIDFMGIRVHKFDRTILGFIYRSLVPKYSKDLDRKTRRTRYRKNLKAFLSLPLVYAGIIPDFWYPMDRYAEVEKDLKSTYFFIPFPNRQGCDLSGRAPRHRAARYDVAKYRQVIRSLVKEGIEVGLHGIDAWRDTRAGKEELDVIRGITGEAKVGVRMHWLYRSEETPAHLEKAGFYFDSSLGYNEAVGYRNGTSQVFRLPGTARVFELPLHVQDTAMFFSGRMGLSELQALGLCEKLLGNFKKFGGVFTINWHDRSLAPERNWDTAYRQVLEILHAQRTWFATAMEAVRWFEARRSIRFVPSARGDGLPEAKAGFGWPANGPTPSLRIHQPSASWRDGEPDPGRYIDYPLKFNEERVAGC